MSNLPSTVADVFEVDSSDGVLRPLGDPITLLSQDPIRILSLSRLVATLGYEPVSELTSAVEQKAELLLDSPREQWLAEMDGLLVAEFAVSGLRFLQTTRVLSLILPEVDAFVDFHRTSPVHHKDLWEHTLQVVSQSARDSTQRWLALIHDVGKRSTRRIVEGNVHFHKHEKMSALQWEGVAHRFHFDPDQARKLRVMIDLHGLVPSYEPSWTDSAVRRLARRCGENLEGLIQFAKADLTTKIPERRRQVLAKVADLVERLREMDRVEAQKPTLPDHIGGKLIAELGLDPGPEVGSTVRRLEVAVRSGRLEDNPSLAACLEFLSEQ